MAGTPVTVWGEMREPAQGVRRLLHERAQPDRASRRPRRSLADATYFPTIGNLKSTRRLASPTGTRTSPTRSTSTCCWTPKRSSRPTTRTSARSTTRTSRAKLAVLDKVPADQSAARSPTAGRRSTNTSPRRPTCGLRLQASARSSSPTRLELRRRRLPAGVRQRLHVLPAQVAGCSGGARGRPSAPCPRVAARLAVDGQSPRNGHRTRDSPAGFPRRRLRPTRAGESPPAPGPTGWRWRRLRRNRVGARLRRRCSSLIVVLCLLAPVYAHDIAHTGPNDNHITEKVKVGGKTEDVVSADGHPDRPDLALALLPGRRQNGRDVAVRLLYGGRNSLEIGAVATLITMLLATTVGLVAGYFRGPVDGVLSRVLDVIWAYPGGAARRRARASLLAVGGLDLGVIDTARATRCSCRRDHRGRLRPLRGQAAARPGAGPARAGVHRRRARAGAGPPADHGSARCCPTSPRRSSCSCR